MNEHIWRGKVISLNCQTLEQLRDALKAEADYIDRCIQAGVKADFSNAEDDYIFLIFTEEQFTKVNAPSEIEAEMPREQLLETAKTLGINVDEWVKEHKTGKRIQIKSEAFEPALRRIVKSLLD